MVVCLVVIKVYGNAKKGMSNNYMIWVLESSTDEANKVLPKSDLVVKAYTINGNYANNQLVIGKDISK